MEYPYVPVGELADLLHPSASRWKALVMLTAYFDVSATEVQTGVTAMAGYVAPKASWEGLEPRWVAETNKWQIPRFHRYDIINTWLGRERGELCIRAFAQLIRAPFLYDLLWSAVIDEDWDALEKPPAFAARFPSVRHFCFEHILYQLGLWGGENTPNEPIAAVFDKDMAPSAANAIFEDLQQSVGKLGVVDSLTWANPQRHRMIETADLAAGEMQQHWFDREYPKAGAGWMARITPQFRAAISGKSFRESGLWDLLTLRGAVLDFIERGDAFYMPEATGGRIIPANVSPTYKPA